MRYILLLILVCTIKLNSFGQSDTFDFKEYLIGDWYFLDKLDNHCDYDSTYWEIAFMDSSFSWIDGCDYLLTGWQYSIDSDSLLRFYGTDTTVFMQGKLIMEHSYCFKMQLSDDRYYTFHRIIDKEYKLSECIYDRHRLYDIRDKLILPSDIKFSFGIESKNYFISCLRNRELWVRMERGEISKTDAIRQVEFWKKTTTSPSEMKNYKILIGMINNL